MGPLSTNTPQLPLRDLIERLRAGDDEAAAHVFRRFSRRLIALARSRLHRRIRAKTEPEDVLQSVFRSFFLRCREGRFEIEDWDGLWSLLTVMTLRKCGNLAGYFRAARRDVARETPPAQGRRSLDIASRDPTPSEGAALTELLVALMSRLDAEQRRILELRLQGYTAAEISTRVDRSLRTIVRKLGRIQERAFELLPEAG